MRGALPSIGHLDSGFSTYYKRKKVIDLNIGVFFVFAEWMVLLYELRGTHFPEGIRAHNVQNNGSKQTGDLF